MELLTVYNDALQPVGDFPRYEVHSKGFLHRTVRLWVVQDGCIWFQLRSKNKLVFPDKLDPAVTGHVIAGESPMGAVLREAREEIGLSLSMYDILCLGQWNVPFTRPDGNVDNELASIFLYTPKEKLNFTLGDEVADMLQIKVDSYDKIINEPTNVIAKSYGYPGRKATFGFRDFCLLNEGEWQMVKECIPK